MLVCRLVVDKYHVGWRRPERIVDGFTLLRALVYTAALLGEEEFVRAVRSCEVEVSALLPTGWGSGVWVPLVPFPSLPVRRKKLLESVSFATLAAFRHLVSFVGECLENGGVPVVIDVSGGELRLSCEPGGSSTGLRVSERVVFEENEGLGGVESGVFEEIVEYRNRIDRVTTSADLFHVSGYRYTGPLWFAVNARDDVQRLIQGLLRVLAESGGIGGLRSRGWGRFRILECVDAREADIPEADKQVLLRHTGYRGEGYYGLLGGLAAREAVDIGKSIVVTRRVFGYAGPPFEEYLLPLVSVADASSIVRLSCRDGWPRCKCFSRVVETQAFSHLVVFNPLMVSGW